MNEFPRSGKTFDPRKPHEIKSRKRYNYKYDFGDIQLVLLFWAMKYVHKMKELGKNGNNSKLPSD